MRPGVTLLASCLLLAACADYSFRPFTVEVSDQTKFAADLKTCQGYAAKYPHPLSVVDLGESAGTGGAQNLAGAAVNPLVPVLGALGGATKEIILDLGASDATAKTIIVRCMAAKGERSRAYLVIDPN